MPVVACPNCRSELDLDPDDIGHRVECPGCLTHFVATRPAEKPPEPPPSEVPPPLPEAESAPPVTEHISELTADEPPPAPPPRPTLAKAKTPTPPAPPERPSRRGNAPVVLRCPACRGAVSVTADDLGHKVECPMCQQVFRAEDPDGGGRRSSRRDDEPSWRRRDSRRSRYDDDDEYDRPRRRRNYRDEDPYESSDPKAWVWQAKRDLTTPGGGLQVLGWLDVAYGGLYILIGVLIGLGVSSGAGGGAGGPTWEVVAMTIGLGVSGIIMGGVKAFGGMAMKKVQNRRLGVIACFAACVPIYLLACLLGFFGPQYMFTCCPAIFTLPSYIVGIVFGIIGLTKLLRKVMNKAFEVNRPDGDVDAV